jgi:hypothetical protein
MRVTINRSQRQREGRKVSKLIETPVDLQDVAEDPTHIAEPVSRPPVVITVQEVAFSTAAAVTLPQMKPTRGTVMASLRAMFRTSAEDDSRPVPRHYPSRREAFIEDAAMAREMRRL